ncbi:MAG: glycosyltransferase family 2 protein [Gemmatimonadota bacterium]
MGSTEDARRTPAAAPSPPDVTVVIPSYNTRDLMEQALRTVQEAGAGLAVEVFVVDNASRDGSPEMVRARFPETRLICNDRNLGFAAANNQAFRQARGRYVLLLNSDTIVRPDTLRTLVGFLDQHPEAGAAGCKILNPDGSLQLESRRGFPTPAAALYKLSGLSRLFPGSRRFGQYNLTYLDPEEVAEVDALSGSCMMVRREVLQQVGQLDEAYFMYGEDLDWCYRMRQAGWRIYYVPHTEIIHFRGESGRPEPMRIQFRKSRAMAIFVQRHMRHRYRFFPLWILHLGILLYGLYSSLGHLARRLAAPGLDAALVLVGLRLGVALRYHADLIPLIQAIELLGNRLGAGVHPTRWLAPPPYSQTQWLVVYGGSTAIWLAAFWLVGLYDRRRRSVPWSVAAVALGFGGVVTTVFFFKAYNFSRLAAGAAWACNTVLVAGWRLAAGWAVRHTSRRGLGRRRLLVVGTDESARELVAFLAGAGGLDSQLVGLVSLEPELRGGELWGAQVVGTVDELASLVGQYHVDELVFTTATISHALHQLGRRSRRLRLRLVPGSFARLVEGERPASLDDLPLVEVAPRRRRPPGAAAP